MQNKNNFKVLILIICLILVEKYLLRMRFIIRSHPRKMLKNQYGIVGVHEYFALTSGG